MHILLVTNYFPPHYTGGAEVVVYNECHGLREQGVDASVLMINARMKEQQDRHREYKGVPIHEITFRPYRLKSGLLQAFDPRIYRAMLAELRRVQPDLVHVHNVSGSTLALFPACRRLGLPVVLTLHDHWLLCPNNMLYRRDGSLCDVSTSSRTCDQCFRRYDFWANVPGRRRLFARLVAGVDLFVSPSQKLVDLHVAAGYDRSRFRVVPNGIKPALFQLPADPAVRAVTREAGRRRSLLFAGAIAENKGILTLVEAAPLLARYVPGIRLVVAGGGDPGLVEALRGVDPDVVELLGQVPFQEMRALYATADLTVVPSLWYENSPMCIYESMLAGTPVLGSEVGGIPELIEPGKTGYTFRRGDPVALTERVIQHFARSARERRDMRRQCVQHSRSHMTLERHLEGMQQVYDEVLVGHTHRSKP
ncbi:MAG: glycosyltransferase family 4 protein [Anaerolineae bacterium]